MAPDRISPIFPNEIMLKIIELALPKAKRAKHTGDILQGDIIFEHNKLTRIHPFLASKKMYEEAQKWLKDDGNLSITLDLRKDPYYHYPVPPAWLRGAITHLELEITSMVVFWNANDIKAIKKQVYIIRATCPRLHSIVFTFRLPFVNLRFASERFFAEGKLRSGFDDIRPIIAYQLPPTVRNRALRMTRKRDDQPVRWSAYFEFPDLNWRDAAMDALRSSDHLMLLFPVKERWIDIGVEEQDPEEKEDSVSLVDEEGWDGDLSEVE